VYEVLSDLKPNGKPKEWALKKKNNLLLVESFQRNFMKTQAAKAFACGTDLEFRVYSDGKRQLTKSNFCKIRLCPMCNWRRSIKIFSQVSRIMDVLEKEHDYRYVFMTLTCKNVKGQDLFDTVRKLIRDFSNMTKLKAFQCFHGFIRVLEVTYSKDRDDFHPHLHVILAVNKSYFKKKDYISQKQLTAIWRKVCGFDYDPMVDIRKVKNNETGEDSGKALGSAVAEVSKYTVKDSDYLEIDRRGQKGTRDIERIDRVVRTLYFALYSLRMLGLGGCFKEVKERLKMGDVEDGSLTDNDELRDDVKYVVEHYQWRAGLSNYVLMERNFGNTIDVEYDEDD